MSARNRSKPLGRGMEFERLIESTLAAYSAKGVAYLWMLPVPTRPVGTNKGVTLYVRSGKAPYDVMGYLPTGTSVGAELKSSRRKSSLGVIRPGARGEGLQYHQLEALALLAECDGLALIVWDNGGEIGVLRGSGILNAYEAYVQNMKAEASGKDAKRGAKSISWDRFEVIENYMPSGDGLGPDWLRKER